MPSTIPANLLKPAAAAAYLGRSPSTLAKSRMKGDGPRFIKLGSSVRYDVNDLREYVVKSARRSTSEKAR
jgi:Helix-turn-helix domain